MSATPLAAVQRSVPQDDRFVPVPTMSSGLLLPYDRIPREPLSAWAERLSQDLVQNLRGLRTVRDLCGAVAANANNTALVALHQGATSVARMLCKRQFCWQHRFSRRSKDEAIAARVVQPWVNLARLDGMSGDWQAALARLAGLRDYQLNGRLELGPVRIRSGAWAAVADTQEYFEETLDTMYVLDSLKVLLLNGKFVETLTFASRLDPDFPRGLLEFGMEASIVAASWLGDAAEARRIAASARSATRGWKHVVFTIRLAEAVAREGDGDEAREVLAPVITVVSRVSAEKKGELQQLYVLQRLSTLCRELGLDQEARSLAEDVYRGARAAADEVFEIESLRTLSAISSGPERKQWLEALARLQETTLYQRYRRRGREAVQSPVLDRTYDQLGEFLAA